MVDWTIVLTVLVSCIVYDTIKIVGKATINWLCDRFGPFEDDDWENLFEALD